MTEASYAVQRANPRFPFFAGGEVTLRDGKCVATQLSELSSRGCYIGTAEPIPNGTVLSLRIHDGMTTCELQGKVIYVHSGGGLGVFGMGVRFEDMRPEQQSAINAWVRTLAG